MTNLALFIQHISWPLVSAANYLAPALAEASHRPMNHDDFTVAAFVVSTAFMGFACVYWACWMHARLGNFRLAVLQDQARAAASAMFRDLLVKQGVESVAVLRSGTKEPEYFGEAEELLQSCRMGQDSPALRDALVGLADNGTGFTLSPRTPDNRIVNVRGVPVGDRAVVYLQAEDMVNSARGFREILDALPMPVWLRQENMSLGWANRAFLTTVAMENLEAAQAAGETLDWSDRDLCASAQKDRKPLDSRRCEIVAGHRRTYGFNIMPLEGASVVGVAVDVSDVARREAVLNLAIDAQSDVMERVPHAIAVFDASQRLASYNAAYVQLWNLPEEWLDAHPSQSEILDRLRDNRRLPEQRNFADWKIQQLQLFADPIGASEEQWHLPGGKSLRITMQPHLQGGLFALYEDISERLRLEASLSLLTQVQRATLDTIGDGIAIFGTDGRLVLHNTLFASMWQMREEELAGQPHFAEIASLCTARIGRDGIWGVVSCGVNSATPERLGEWGKAKRADGRVISLAMSRLPNGETVVNFSDLTDVERFDELKGEAKIDLPLYARI